MMIRPISLICLIAFATSAFAGHPIDLHRDSVTNVVDASALDMNSVTLTIGSVTISDAAGIRTWSLGSTNGTKIGATGDKIGFLGATPIVRPSGNLFTGLTNLGLITSPSLTESNITNLTADLANKQPLDSDLTAIAALTTTSYARTILTIGSGKAVISYFGLTKLADYNIIDAQPLDSDLTAIAALTTTSFGRNLLTTSSVSNLGAQPLDADLTAIAGLTTTSYGRGFNALADTVAALAYIGAEPSDADLDAIAALSTTSFGRSFLTLANAAAGRTLLGLTTVAYLDQAQTFTQKQTFGNADVNTLLTIGGGDGVSKWQKATITWDIPSTVSGSNSTTDVTITGVLSTDSLVVTPSQITGGILGAKYRTTDTVQIVFWNLSGLSIDPAAATYTVEVIRH